MNKDTLNLIADLKQEVEDLKAVIKMFEYIYSNFQLQKEVRENICAAANKTPKN